MLCTTPTLADAAQYSATPAASFQMIKAVTNTWMKIINVAVWPAVLGA